MIKSEDPGFYKKVKRISANYSTPKQGRTTKENTNTQETQSFVKVRCVSLKEIAEQKMNLLIEYFKTNEGQPSVSKTAEYNKHGFNLRHYWYNLVSGKNKQLFENALEQSPNMQKAYDKYLEKKEIESKKVKFSPPEKINNLIEYFETNEEPPSQYKKDEYNKKYGFNLGQFWGSLTGGTNKSLFEDAKKKSPNMQKAYDKYLEKKEIESKKVKFSPPEKINNLIEYFETNEEPPSQYKKDEYNKKYGFNLGQFWGSLTGGTNKELFENALEQSPNMKKAYYKHLEKREIESNKDKKTAQQKMKILIECFKNTDFAPSRSKTDEYNKKHGFNFGIFWSNLVKGRNKELFKDALKQSPNMQKTYDTYLEGRENRRMGIVSGRW